MLAQHFGRLVEPLLVTTTPALRPPLGRGGVSHAGLFHTRARNAKPLHPRQQPAIGLELSVAVQAELLGNAQRQRFGLDHLDLGVHRDGVDGIVKGRNALLYRFVDLPLRVEDQDLGGGFVHRRHRLDGAVGDGQRQHRDDRDQLPPTQHGDENRL